VNAPGSPAATASVPVLVLGGSGYVGGELLRLLLAHPVFRIAGVVSESRGATDIGAAFPHLRGCGLDDATFHGFEQLEALVAPHSSLGVFSALPHGEAAAKIDRLLTIAERAGCAARVVDLSADFRHREAERYAAIYGKPHGAPRRLAEFVCALPELTPADATPATHVAHPGCFTTAATLALAPLFAGGWIEPDPSVVAITGSTGAGRTPTRTTHHPERRSDLFAYAPMAHRHEPEIRALVARAANLAGEPEIAFLPHSGPFARGIHATVTATLTREATSDEIHEAVTSYYESHSPSPFVNVLPAPPRLQSVVGTNRCDLACAVRGRRLVAWSALDNLTKGAAGGGIQWMNRLFGLGDDAGLRLPGLGWL